MIAILCELWRFLWVRKKYWLFPVLLMLTIFGALIVLTESSVVATFMYTLF